MIIVIREGNFEERPDVIKKDLEEKLSVKYLSLSNVFVVENIFLVCFYTTGN